MAEDSKQNAGLIFITFILAMALTVVPLPEWARAFRPEWITLVLVYWCLTAPTKINVGIGWIAGFAQDVLIGSLLGQHALALTVVAFVTIKIHKQLRIYPMWQQALSVFVLIALSQLLVVWVKGIIGDTPASWLYWAPSFTSALLWPWVYLLLSNSSRRFRTNN